MAALTTEPGRARAACRMEVRGTVQGVGFRPFVYRLASRLGLDGTVRNAGGYVVVEAAGPATAVAELARRLRTEAPPRARVTDVHTLAHLQRYDSTTAEVAVSDGASS